MGDRDERYRAGDHYDRTFTHLKAHEGDCASCAWFGDDCPEREKLIEAFLTARKRAKKLRSGALARESR
jgi:hypothetical protein